jgi:hypothetical protein
VYPFYLELELIKPVIDYFSKQGYIVKREVKIGFYKADIIAFKRENVVAVELKLRDWKKAIIQAKNYQLGADYVYIAVPLMRSFNILKKAKHKFEIEGIGLLIVNEKTCKVGKLIDAKLSEKKMGIIQFDQKNSRKNIVKFRGRVY